MMFGSRPDGYTACHSRQTQLPPGMLRSDSYREATIAPFDALAGDGRVPDVLAGTDRAHLIGQPQPPQP